MSLILIFLILDFAVSIFVMLMIFRALTLIPRAKQMASELAEQIIEEKIKYY
jgi:hypothetical protein